MAIIGIDLGISNSAAAVLRGGRPVQSRAGLPGDLHVVVRTRPDPRFQRDGADP